MLKDRYEAEEQMLREELKDKYGETQRYHDAMIELDASYNAEKAEILEKSERKFASIIKSYRDIWKEHALSEKEYKLEMLDDWYAEREQKLWDDYGDTKRYYDAIEELDRAYAARRAVILGSAFEQTMNKIFAGARNILGGLDAIFSQFHANEAMRIDNEEEKKTEAIESWYERKKAKLESTIADEELLNEALAKLDEEKAEKTGKLEDDIEKKRKKLQLKQAKAQKAAALFSAGINLAEAITKVFAQTGIFGTVASAIVAGLMAVQIAAIAAAPLPALQRGGMLGAGEPAIVGEAGPELFVPATPGAIIPLRGAMGGEQLGGARVSFNFYAPIIQTTGIARRDVDGITEYFFRKMEGEARRRGWALNG